MNDNELKYNDNELKARGMKQNNNLFRMFIKVQRRSDANMVAVSNLKRWHERLGHINYKYYKYYKFTPTV